MLCKYPVISAQRSIRFSGISLNPRGPGVFYVEMVRRAGVEEAKVIGDKAVVRGAITGQVVFHRLDVVIVLAVGTVQTPI